MVKPLSEEENRAVVLPLSLTLIPGNQIFDPSTDKHDNIDCYRLLVLKFIDKHKD